MSSPVAVRTRPLRVAVELTDSGHHPALHRRPDVRSPLAQTDYWIELTSQSDPNAALDLIAEPANVIRIRAADLREAQKARAAIRAELGEQGRDPDSVTVLLDVEVLIAPEAATARVELAQLDAVLQAPRTQKSITYVGTPSGLAGLIADIYAAEVADGVTLLPLSLPGSLDLIEAEVSSLLGKRGLGEFGTRIRFRGAA